MERSLIGREGTPFPMTVEPGKVREFARATRSGNPAYAGPDAVVPPTFLMTSAFWSGPENSPWGPDVPDLARVLHGEQEFVFPAGPLRVGARLIGTSRIENVYTKEGKRGGSMDFAELVVDYRDADTGEIVAQSRSTLIETSKSTVE